MDYASDLWDALCSANATEHTLRALRQHYDLCKQTTCCCKSPEHEVAMEHLAGALREGRLTANLLYAETVDVDKK